MFTFAIDSDTILRHNLRPDTATPDHLARMARADALGASAAFGAELARGGAVVDVHGTLWAVGGDSRGRLVVFDGVRRCEVDIDGFRSLSVLPTSPSAFWVFRGEGYEPVQLVARGEGGWTTNSLAAPGGVVALRAVAGGVVSAPVGPLSLRGTYSSRSSSLERADLAALGSAMEQAYETLCSRADAARAFFQPVLTRYRLVSPSGSVAYASEPVILSLGPQALSVGLTLSGPEFSRTGEAQLMARCFTIEMTHIHPLAEAWCQAYGHVEVQLAPQFHPLAPGALPEVRMGSFTATEGSLTVALPGVGIGRNGISCFPLLDGYSFSILSRLDEAMATVGTVAVDSGRLRLETSPQLYPALSQPFSAQLKSLREACSGAAPAPGADLEACRALAASGGIDAGVSAVVGDLVIYSDLTALPQPAPPAGGFTVTSPLPDGSEERLIPCASLLEMADGSSTLTSGHILSSRSGSVSPLICCRGSDARRLTLIVGTSKVSVPLTPCASGEWSYYLHPSCAPFGLPDSLPSFILPEPNPAPRRFPGLVAVAPVGSPMRPMAVARLPGGSPVAITPAPGGSGLDSGTARALLFNSAGTHRLSVSSARSVVRTALVDSRPVTSGSAVALAGSGVAVRAGGDLLLVSGAWTVRTLRRRLGEASLAWDADRGEILCLWIGGAEAPDPVRYLSGHTRVELRPDAMAVRPDGSVAYTFDLPPGLSRVVPAPGALLASGPGGPLYDLLSRSGSPLVGLLLLASGPKAPVPPSEARFALPAPSSFGLGEEDPPVRYEIRSHRGGGHLRSWPVVSVSLSPAVAHSLPVRAFVPHSHGFSLLVTVPSE